MKKLSFGVCKISARALRELCEYASRQGREYVRLRGCAVNFADLSKNGRMKRGVAFQARLVVFPVLMAREADTKRRAF